MAIQSKVFKRIFFGSIMIAVLSGLLYGQGWLSCNNYYAQSGNWAGIGFACIAALLLMGASVELVRFARAKDIHPSLWVILVAVVALVFQPYWPTKLSISTAVMALIFASMLVSALLQGVKRGTDNTMSNLGLSTFIIIYLGLGGYFLVSIRLLGGSAETPWGQISYFVMFIATVKCADIGAYFTGRAIGKHKWVPSISPAKTWEGFFGGVALSVISASLFAGLGGIMYTGRAVLFGIAIAVAGQLGDLLESMLKRDAGIKDSASLIPEFGGVMDVLDSPLVAAPIAYGLFLFLA